MIYNGSVVHSGGAQKEAGKEEKEAAAQADDDRDDGQGQNQPAVAARVDALPAQVLHNSHHQSDDQHGALLDRAEEEPSAVQGHLLRARAAPAPLRPRRRSRHLGKVFRRVASGPRLQRLRAIAQLTRLTQLA